MIACNFKLVPLIPLPLNKPKNIYKAENSILFGIIRLKYFQVVLTVSFFVRNPVRQMPIHHGSFYRFEYPLRWGIKKYYFW